MPVHEHCLPPHKILRPVAALAMTLIKSRGPKIIGAILAVDSRAIICSVCPPDTEAAFIKMLLVEAVPPAGTTFIVIVIAETEVLQTTSESTIVVVPVGLV
jgi:hypothetical protein